MYLQDSGAFEAAEAAFLLANKPREAIEMYTHQQQWSAALRVAQAHDAASVTAILRQKGDALVAADKLTDAEAVFTQAHAPERAVRAYRNAGRWEDALRVARHWQPELVAETEAARAAAAHGSNAGGDGGLSARLQQARMLERQVCSYTARFMLFEHAAPCRTRVVHSRRLDRAAAAVHTPTDSH